MKIFIVFDLPQAEDWGNQSIALAAGSIHSSAANAARFVVIDNDSSPELADPIRSVAETVGAKVHRIVRTPMWKIVSDIFTGQAASGSQEPVLVASAGDRRLVNGITINGLLGPAGDVSERFVFSSNPAELMATILAKTKGLDYGDVFAPALYAARGGELLVRPPLGNLATVMGVDVAPPPPGEEPARPPALHPILERFYLDRLGPEATSFLVSLQTASQIADDFVDGGLRPSWRADAMREMLEILLIRIPNDPFYLANKEALDEVTAQCLTLWALSNELEGEPTPESRMWCYIQREAFQLVVWRVAVLVGGLDLGRSVLREIQQILHGPASGSKKFHDWLGEVRTRAGRG